MTSASTILGVAAVLFANACGSDRGATDDAPPSRDDVAAYELLVADVQTHLVAYRQIMDSDDMSESFCIEVHQRYDARQRARIADMLTLSQRLDEVMSEHAPGGQGDNACIVGMMFDELEDHGAVACRFEDWPDNRAEAMRHIDAMEARCQDAAQRCEELMGGLTDGQWHFGPMMDACGGCPDDAGHGMMHCQD